MPTVFRSITELTIISDGLKEMDNAHYAKLLFSLTNHGQLRNILIDENNNVVEGRRILQAAADLRWHEIECKIVKDTFLPRLALDCEYSEFDFVEVSQQLCKKFELENKELLYGLLPFTNSDIEDYIESTKFNWENYNKKAESGKNTQSLF